MTESRNIHWTDDEELLSKFVLHRLPKGEGDELSSHLNTCEKCRRAVREETTIIAGTKLAGRTEMQERLRLRLSESKRHVAASAMRRPPRHQIHWTQIVSVAAVVMIIVVVGVYNNWFSANDWRKSPRQDQLSDEKKPSPLPKEEPEKVSPAIPPRDELAETANTPDKNRLGTSQVNRALRQRGAVSEDKNRAEKQSAAPVPTEVAGKTNAGAATLEESKVGKNETRLMDQAMISPPQVFWVEAHVLPNTLKKDRGALNSSPSDRAYNTIKQQAEARSDLQQLSKTGADTVPTMFTLVQKPSSSLPLSLQYGFRSGAVQTFIEKRSNAIQMTLYLDSAVAESELRSANIEMINADSLIVDLSSQRIGLRLPQAVQGQVNTKAKQVK